MTIERYYKRPQDVEWAFDQHDNLHVLQSRPLNIRPRTHRSRPCLDETVNAMEVIFSNKGIVVQGGVATGKVHVAHDVENLNDFPHGAILVARYTSPRYARIMRKAQGMRSPWIRVATRSTGAP